MDYHNEVKVALDAVGRAMAVCRAVEERFDRIAAVQKADRSPVTLADFGSQAVISRLLQRAFPRDPLVGEETGRTLRRHPDLGTQVLELVRRETDLQDLDSVIAILDSADPDADFKERLWTLDPIDGTKGFLRGDQYAVAVALLEQGEVVLGVLGCPNYPAVPPGALREKGAVFYAVRGQGAWMQMNGEPDPQTLSVDSITDSKAARICESVESDHASHGTHQTISALLGISAPPLRMDSQVKYAAVARGDASLYLRIPKRENYREKIWDHAAGAVIVEEAGGRVTDLDGKPIDFSAGKELRKNRGIVASNRYLHPGILDAVSRALGG